MQKANLELSYGKNNSQSKYFFVDLPQNVWQILGNVRKTITLAISDGQMDGCDGNNG